MVSIENRRPLVSVIIPTHNRVGPLQEALASVYAQEGEGKLFDLEIIVVDDASSDATPQAMRGFPDIRYIRLDKNHGLSGARNVGIKASTGKYIAFLDDDDLWMSDKLSLLVPILESDPNVGVAYAQVIVRCRNNIELIPDLHGPSGYLFRTLLMRDFIGILNILVRREAFDKAGYFDEQLSTYEDIDWMLRLAFHVSFKFIAGPVAVYRLSYEGKYLTDIVQARTEWEFRPIIEKALTMLPDNAKDARKLRQQVLARVELKIAEELEWAGEMEWMERESAQNSEAKQKDSRPFEKEIFLYSLLGSRMWAHLLEALKECPTVSANPSAKLLIRRQMRRMCLASKDPFVAVRTSCTKIRALTKGGGLAEWWRMRELLADLWSEAAHCLATLGLHRLTGQAVLYAILKNPIKIGRVGLWITRLVILAPLGHLKDGVAVRSFPFSDL
jgi:glycosyltransferase involved in cell wall biosynthesis